MKDAKNYILKNPYVFNYNDEMIANLSPSEKYDLLIGKDIFPLTKHMWNQGKQNHDRNGEVENWMDTCHGWATASFVMDATLDYEVWNQPIISYQYKYFNPLTKQNVLKQEDAIIEIDQYTDDNF